RFASGRGACAAPSDRRSASSASCGRGHRLTGALGQLEEEALERRRLRNQRNDAEPGLDQASRERGDGVLLGGEYDLLAVERDLAQAGRTEADRVGQIAVGCPQPVARRGARAELGERALVDDSAGSDDGDPRAQLLDL